VALANPGCQSWPQPPFQAAGPARERVRGLNSPPHICATHNTREIRRRDSAPPTRGSATPGVAARRNQPATLAEVLSVRGIPSRAGLGVSRCFTIWRNRRMRQVCTVVWEDGAARASGRRSTVRIILGHGQKIRQWTAAHLTQRRCGWHLCDPCGAASQA
jgi:hypothetical protein